MVITALIVYSVLIIAASMAGGALTQKLRVTHLGMQMIMSLVGGLILGVAILHMLPHAIASAPNHLNSIMLSTLGGVLGMLLLMRLFHFHQHPSDEPDLDRGHECEHDHDHDHKHAHSHEQGNTPTQSSLRWLGLALGMTVHSLLDGVAIASYVAADHHQLDGPVPYLPGLGIFVAILLHKPLDASSIVWMMKSSGWSARAILVVNLVFAITTPIGAWLFYAGLVQFGSAAEGLLAFALGFSAGVFLCISLSDILPEVQFHRHDRVKLTASLLVGVAFAWAIGLLEPKSAHSVTSQQRTTPAETDVSSQIDPLAEDK